MKSYVSTVVKSYARICGHNTHTKGRRRRVFARKTVRTIGSRERERERERERDPERCTEVEKNTGERDKELVN